MQRHVPQQGQVRSEELMLEEKRSKKHKETSNVAFCTAVFVLVIVSDASAPTSTSVLTVDIELFVL